MTTLTRDHQTSLRFAPSGGDSNGDGRSFAGYGAVFNSFTRIDSWEGTFDEQFAPGAFAATLRAQKPKFQFDHGRHPLIGSVPIGVITEIREDATGLYVEARLGKHSNVDFVREAIETGAIDGMSIRFSVVSEEWRDSLGNVVAPTEVDAILWGSHPERGVLQRTILEAKLDEVGPVVWPAYADTTAGVRSADPVDRLIAKHRSVDNPTSRQIEQMIDETLVVIRSMRGEKPPERIVGDPFEAALAEVRAVVSAHPHPTDPKA